MYKLFEFNCSLGFVRAEAKKEKHDTVLVEVLDSYNQDLVDSLTEEQRYELLDIVNTEWIDISDYVND